MSERTVQQPIAAERQAKFSDLPTADVERSTFDMSHSWKGTMDTNRIVPCLLQEILPGDTFKISSKVFMRLATPIKPLMDSITADIHYFFVPNRLVWDNWQYFMGERKAPEDDPTTLSIPQMEIDLDYNTAQESLVDYFGLPLIDPVSPGDGETEVNALPFRAYSLIFNEWYRNQNIDQERAIDFGDGPTDGKNMINGPAVVHIRHKRGDYFTRALPWPQKGDPVFLPLGTYAPVEPRSAPNPGGPASEKQPTFILNGATGGATAQNLGMHTGGDNRSIDAESATDGGAFGPLQWADPKLHVDLTTATAATINDMRTAFQIQKLLERDARGGTRYIEILLSHFNVRSPDMRLQRPEYLGGGSSRIVISPVAATVATVDAPQGNLAAVGTGLLTGNMNHSFVEHGHLLALISCRTDLTYQNGLDRFWSRQTRYDFYWPALSHLGEQAILNKEIWWDDVGGENDSTWGFQERYAEYRYQPGRITGLFRSNATSSLDVWHLAQDFDALPGLNAFFTYELPPIDRVVAVPSEPDLIVDAWHEMQATRAMPVYAVPGLVDHF